jgi:hypothetical protein
MEATRQARVEATNGQLQGTQPGCLASERRPHRAAACRMLERCHSATYPPDEMILEAMLASVHLP